MDMKIIGSILSFKDVIAEGNKARRSVLFLRHTMRSSLKHGTDPDLTAEGEQYALACGKMLSPWKGDVCFGASGRIRTRRTAECLIRGGDLDAGEIATYDQVRDDAMFLSEEALFTLLRSDHVQESVNRYYATGTEEGMIPLSEFAQNLTCFLTETPFAGKNAIVISHDILIAALLLYWKVYPFDQTDWLGYIQGAALFQDQAGVWSIGYVVPEVEKRSKFTLYV